MQYMVTFTSFNIFSEVYIQEVPSRSTCHVLYIQLFLLSGKLEMIFIDIIGISTLYLYTLKEISVSLKLNIVSHIPGSKMESILYPWK